MTISIYRIALTFLASFVFLGASATNASAKEIWKAEATVLFDDASGSATEKLMDFLDDHHAGSSSEIAVGVAIDAPSVWTKAADVPKVYKVLFRKETQGSPVTNPRANVFEGDATLTALHALYATGESVLPRRDVGLTKDNPLVSSISGIPGSNRSFWSFLTWRPEQGSFGGDKTWQWPGQCQHSSMTDKRIFVGFGVSQWKLRNGDVVGFNFSSTRQETTSGTVRWMVDCLGPRLADFAPVGAYPSDCSN